MNITVGIFILYLPRSSQDGGVMTCQVANPLFFFSTTLLQMRSSWQNRSDLILNEAYSGSPLRDCVTLRKNVSGTCLDAELSKWHHCRVPRGGRGDPVRPLSRHFGQGFQIDDGQSQEIAVSLHDETTSSRR